MGKAKAAGNIRDVKFVAPSFYRGRQNLACPLVVDEGPLWTTTGDVGNGVPCTTFHGIVPGRDSPWSSIAHRRDSPLGAIVPGRDSALEMPSIRDSP